MTTAQSILERVHSLPALSSTVARLSVLLRDERSGAGEFERAIRPDPALTANLLKLANSAYFGLSKQVKDVRQAIATIGLVKVYGVAACAAVARLVPPRLAGYEIESSAFWQHSSAVGVLSERLAGEIGVRAPDLTFTAGLLHDVGKLAVSTFLAAESREVAGLMHEQGMAYVDAERTALGTDHAEVGAAVAERWNLPVAVGHVAAGHHRPDAWQDGPYQVMVDLVHIADCLAHSMGLGADAGGMARTADAGAGERLDLKPRRLERVAGESLDAIREMGNLFGGTPGGSQ
jgi:putative nucleotidyltransferase with HDIG domain